MRIKKTWWIIVKWIFFIWIWEWFNMGRGNKKKKIFNCNYWICKINIEHYRRRRVVKIWSILHSDNFISWREKKREREKRVGGKGKTLNACMQVPPMTLVNRIIILDEGKLSKGACNFIIKLWVVPGVILDELLPQLLTLTISVLFHDKTPGTLITFTNFG